MGIRRATPGDLAAVLKINSEGFVGDDPFDAAWLVAKLAEPGTRLVVDDAGVNVMRGFMLTQHYASGVEVVLIAVDRQLRRHGVGRRLLARVKGPAGAWVRKENAASRALFAGAGWEQSVSEWTEAEKPEKHSGEWCYYVLSRSRAEQ